MALLGYARVSTGEQQTGGQEEALRRAGAARVFTETASGAARARPELERCLAALKPGDVLLVVRLDRLARSLAHLLEIVAGLEARGVGFRSLADPIDTTSAQGRLTLAILGAVAEFERALIRERTKAGLARARAEGRRAGNPALATSEGRRALARARDHARSAALIEGSGPLVALLARLRPATPWESVARIAAAQGLARPAGGGGAGGGGGGRGGAWTRDALIRAARRFVRDGILPGSVLERSPPAPSAESLVATLAALHAALARDGAAPSLAALARALEAARIATPRGGRRWSPSSVRHLLDRAVAAGLIRS
jgi:DNA invertase Pin-like site-specific DNA recombinase